MQEKELAGCLAVATGLPRGRSVVHSTIVYGLRRLGPSGPCPLNSGVPGVVQLQQTRTGRPTQPLQRTPEAFSTVVACEGRWLRGTAVAFKRRTLNGISVRRLEDLHAQVDD